MPEVRQADQVAAELRHKNVEVDDRVKDSKATVCELVAEPAPPKLSTGEKRQELHPAQDTGTAAC